MNQVVELPRSGITATSGRMAVADLIGHVATVQEVMKAVMKPDVHYGVIPGTDKPTLLKPGAELLCMVFRIADSYHVEDLSTADTVRYRVTCTGAHQATGMVLGTGMGEASSGEEKYKWRKAYEAEYNDTPPAMRRKKQGYSKAKREHYSTFQVRTEPADLANTILKMANKRAKMAMVLNVTAASDCFSQDLEDLDAALRDSLTAQDDHHEPAATAAPATPATWPQDAFDKQFPRWEKAIQGGLKSQDDILALARTKGALTPEQEASIRGVKVAEKPPEPEPVAEAGPPPDDFVADMNAAEAQQ